MWRKVMARPRKRRTDFEVEAPRVDSTIRPPPRAIDETDDDLELEDDAETTIAPLRWPEPPKDLAERLSGVRTDGVGLSRSVKASARPRWSWLWRSLGVAIILGAALRIVPLRPHYRAASPGAAPRRPEPVAVVAHALIAPPAAPVEVPAPSPPPAPAKPAIDVTSLPKAAPTAAPPRPSPKRIVVAKPAARTAPSPAPAPPAEPAATIDEDAYEAVPTPKCRTCAKAENPY
jgi:hypothetical protein